MLGFKRLLIWVALLGGVTFSCTPEDDVPGFQQQPDNFDRKAMLTHWADNFIIPGYISYHQKLTDLKASTQGYTANPTVATYNSVYADFREAYLAWQWVSIFEIGPAESTGLRNFTNIYPANATGIENAIQQQNFNFTLPSTFAQQGFPAIDYLLSGKGDVQTTNTLMTGNSDYANYLTQVVDRLVMLCKTVLDQWQGSYHSEFINKDGSSATESVNKLTNDFVFHYEKELRAGKIGIPVGVFSGDILPNTVEAFYSDTLSKSLFLESLEAHRKFFAGQGFGEQASGNSLKSYLDYLGTEKNGGNLSDKILDQFASALSASNVLTNSFADAAQNQGLDMLTTYDELQKNVVMLKVDMLQALNIKVDYVDADGD